MSTWAQKVMRFLDEFLIKTITPEELDNMFFYKNPNFRVGDKVKINGYRDYEGYPIRIEGEIISIHSPFYIIKAEGHEYRAYESDLELLKPRVCECGKDKHGFASHSKWCDKHAE